MAAEAGHVPAMYELGLSGNGPDEKRRWLEEAARKGCQAAMLELSELAYLNFRRIPDGL
jgi:TPR repeat protein